MIRRPPRSTHTDTLFPYTTLFRPNNQVGAAVEGSPLAKVTHRQRMMSLDNAFAAEDVEEFAARVRRFLNLAADAAVAMTAEDKIDGRSEERRGGKERVSTCRSGWRAVL